MMEIGAFAYSMTNCVKKHEVIARAKLQHKKKRFSDEQMLQIIQHENCVAKEMKKKAILNKPIT